MLGKKWGIFFATSGLQFFCHSGLQKSQEVGGYICWDKKCIVHFPTYLSREESMYIYTKTDQTMESLFKNNVNCLQNNVLICIWHVTVLSDAIKKKLNAQVEKM